MSPLLNNPANEIESTGLTTLDGRSGLLNELGVTPTCPISPPNGHVAVATALLGGRMTVKPTSESTGDLAA